MRKKDELTVTVVSQTFPKPHQYCVGPSSPLPGHGQILAQFLAKLGHISTVHLLVLPFGDEASGTHESSRCRSRDRSGYRPSLLRTHFGRRARHHQSRGCSRGKPLSRDSRQSVLRVGCRGCDHWSQSRRAIDNRRMSGCPTRPLRKEMGGD